MESGPIWDIVSPYLEGAKKSGDSNVLAKCPFHKDRTPSFAINIKNGKWICYGGCGAGYLGSFLSRVGKSRRQIDSIITPIRDQIDANIQKHIRRTATRFRTDLFRGEHILPEALLGIYDFCPAQLVAAGFNPTLLRQYEIGYDRKLERITFPIRDLYGNLVGISGRTEFGFGNRYKFYTTGFITDNGYVPGDFGENFDEVYKGYTFDKSRYLWNADRVITWLIEADTDTPLIITEGFKACLWLIQSGFSTTVATMGSSISATQVSLVQRVQNPVIIFFDNDEAGRRGAQKAKRLIAKSNHKTHVVEYTNSTVNQPDDLNKKALSNIIDNACRRANGKIR